MNKNAQAPLDEQALIDRLRSAHPFGEAPPSLGGLGDLREFARGGQSVVYLAREIRSGRTVAIKIFQQGSMTARAARDQFIREAQATLRLVHPGIVRVRDIGFAADGRPYLVSDFVRGQRLDEYVRIEHETSASSGDRVDRMLRVFLQICRAVQFAHQKGVLHCDLKPGNIRINESGEPCVLDFGLARLDPSADPAHLCLTVSGQPFGTPAYVAPEQARGEIDLIDARTDVYALGVLLYEMLTGTRAFRTDGGLARTFDAICNGEPPRASRVNRILTREHDAIILKAMARTPAARYQSVDALADDVQRLMDGLSVKAHPPGAMYELRAWVRRHKPVAMLAAALIFAITASGAGAVMLAGRLNDQRLAAVEAQMETERARVDEHKARQSAERVTQSLAGIFQMADPALAGGSITVDQMLSQAVDRLRVELADDPGAAATVLATIGTAYRRLAQYDAARQCLEESVDLRARHDGLGSDPYADALHLLAELDLSTGRHQSAETLFRESMRIRRMIHGATHPSVASALAGLSTALREAGRRDEALVHTVEAHQMRQSLLGPDHPDTIRSLMMVGTLQSSLLDFDQADASLVAALEAAERVLGADHFDTGACSFELALLHYRRGDYRSALGFAQRALENRRRLLSDDHPEVGKCHGQLAMILSAMGRPNEALAHSESALAIRENQLDQANPALAISRSNHAGILIELQRFAEAEVMLRESCSQLAVTDGDGHPRLLTCLLMLGQSQLGLNRLEDAAAQFNRVLEADRLRSTPDPRTQATALLGLAEIAFRLHDMDQALGHVEQALVMLEKQLGASHSRVRSALVKLAQFHLASGDAPQAADICSGLIDGAATGEAGPADLPDALFVRAMAKCIQGDLAGFSEDAARARLIVADNQSPQNLRLLTWIDKAAARCGGAVVETPSNQTSSEATIRSGFGDWLHQWLESAPQ